MPYASNHPDISYIPFDDVLKGSRHGHADVLRDRWWACHPTRGLIIFRKSSPQCNPNQEIALSLMMRLYPWAEVRQIPLVLLPHNCKDYVG